MEMRESAECRQNHTLSPSNRFSISCATGFGPKTDQHADRHTKYFLNVTFDQYDA